MLDFLGKDFFISYFKYFPRTKEHYDKDALTMENFSKEVEITKIIRILVFKGTLNKMKNSFEELK